MRELLATVLIASFLVSCGPAKREIPIKSRFETEFTTLRRINLSKVFGDTLKISEAGSERTFAIQFDKNGRTNQIIEIGKGPIFSGTACKYKGLYFFNTEVDSGFHLSAFQFENKELIGFPELNEQMFEIDKMVEQGFMDEVLLRDTENSYLLQTDKRFLHDIYAGVLLQFPNYSIED